MTQTGNRRIQSIGMIIQSRWFPLVVIILVSQLLLLGPVLWSGGLAKGMDMNASLITGYEAANGSWHEIWDDSRFPGSPKNVSRFTTTELAMTWLSEITGNPFLSSRLMLWGLNTLALVGMYFLAKSVTGSRTAGAVAGIAYLFNRGAALRIGMPLAAGFALLPFVFLSLDLLLRKPSLKRALVFSITAALFVTSTVPGFAYIVVLAVVIYVAAFFVARSLGGNPYMARRVEFSNLRRPALYGLLAVVAAFALSAYFFFGLGLSTLPVVEETGGFEFEAVTERLPSLSDAIALSAPAFELGTTSMNVIGWFLAGIALIGIGASLKVDFRVVSLTLIAAGAVFLASNAGEWLYRFLFDNLPYFSLVRGASRWIALALFAYSLLLAIGVSAAISRVAKAIAYTDGKTPVARLILPYGILSIVVGIVVVNALVQLSALRQWTTPYELSDDFFSPFHAIAELDARRDVVYSTSPFLATRLTDEPFISAIDFGRTLGPAESGRSALGGFRVGGLDVGGEIRSMLGNFATPEARKIDLLTISDAPVRLPPTVSDFFLIADVRLENASVDGVFQLRFRQQEVRAFPILKIYPARNKVELESFDDRSFVLSSARHEFPLDGQFHLAVSAFGPEMSVWIDAERVLKTSNAGFGTGGVSALSQGLTASLSDIEVSAMPTDGLADDAFITNLMSLFNVGYHVVQPHTSQIERERIANVSGLRQIGEWEQASLYENDRYVDGKAFFTPSYALYLGSSDRVVPSLYKLNPLYTSKYALIDAADISGGITSDFADGAEFIAIDASRQLPPRDTVLLGNLNETIPSMYFTDVSSSRASVRRVLDIPEFVLVTERPIELLNRVRNFVLEFDIEAVDSFSPVLALDFRARDTLRFYTIEFDSETPKVSFIVNSPQGRRVIDEANIGSAAQISRIRIGAEDDKFSVYVDGELALQVQDATYSEAGPISISSNQEGIDLSNFGVAVDRDGQTVRDILRDSGFDIEQATTLTPNIGRDQFSMFPSLQARNSRMLGINPGEYQLMVVVQNAESEVILSEITINGVRSQVSLTLGHSANEQAFFVSEPLRVDSDTVDIFAAIPGEESQIIMFILAEVQGDATLFDKFLTQTPFDNANAVRAGATRYEGELRANEGGVIIFQEYFDDGWDTHLGDIQLEHFRVFGTLNGYLVPPIDSDTSLNIRYSPQGVYNWGFVISGLSFLVILGALVRIGTQRYRRGGTL